MNAFLSSHAPKVLSLLRIITGFLYIWHGSQKLFNYPMPQLGGATDGFFIFGGVLEFFGGLLIMLGLGTRWTAFILSGQMAVAYFMFHAKNGLFSQKTGAVEGELAVLYCFVFFFLFFAGGGPFSVDALFKRSTVSAD